MKAYLEAEKQDFRRRRRERIVIACLVVLIPIIAYLGIKVLDLGLDLPIANSILIFVLIDINVILLLLLIYLTMRNLVKLVFERRKKLMGAKLRTKLVMAFITLSLLPTVILFFVSVQFISTSIEYWFNIPMERSLKSSLEVGQSFYTRVVDELLSHGTPWAASSATTGTPSCPAMTRWTSSSARNGWNTSSPPSGSSPRTCSSGPFPGREARPEPVQGARGRCFEEEL